jgi:predicted NBD/HSP70 family sugar kinase
VRHRVAERLGAPVAIENDANVELLAELARGAGQGLRHALFVHVGYGIGGAVVLDGRLYRGGRGMAGELAHLPVRGARGPTCPCGRRDCLGSIASGWALLQATAIVHGSALGLSDLVALALAGDPGIGHALADAGDAIGVVLAELCSTLNPEAVIVGGPLGFGASPLVAAAERRIARDVHPTIGPVSVRPAALSEVGGALGAAIIVVRSGEKFDHLIPIA